MKSASTMPRRKLFEAAHRIGLDQFGARVNVQRFQIFARQLRRWQRALRRESLPALRG